MGWVGLRGLHAWFFLGRRCWRGGARRGCAGDRPQHRGRGAGSGARFDPERALPRGLVFLRAKGFSGGDPFFLSQERSIDGVLVRTLASFAEYVKDLQERGSSKTAMLDLRNAFLRRGLAVLAFNELVLKARANREKSGRKVSEEKDGRGKAAVTPDLFLEFLRLF